MMQVGGSVLQWRDLRMEQRHERRKDRLEQEMDQELWGTQRNLGVPCQGRVECWPAVKNQKRCLVKMRILLMAGCRLCHPAATVVSG